MLVQKGQDIEFVLKTKRIQWNHIKFFPAVQGHAPGSVCQAGR